MSMVAVNPLRKLPRLGPDSRTLKRGVLGDTVDGRSTEGRFLLKIEAELTRQIGQPSFTEKMLIRRLSRAMLDLLPSINARRIDLLDDKRLQTQLCGLERRTARSGKDSIDHGPGGHDDVANCVAGIAGLLATDSGYMHDMNWVLGDASCPMAPPLSARNAT